MNCFTICINQRTNTFFKTPQIHEPQVNYCLIFTDTLEITRLQAKKDNDRREELGVMDAF